MHKTLLIFLVALLVTPTLAYAQTATSPATTKTNSTVKERLQTAAEKRAATLKENVLEQKAEAQEKRTTIREAALERKEDREASRAARREELKERREAFKEELAAKREAAKAQFKVQRDEFKKDLAAIRDEKKQVIVERVDTKLSTINEDKTNRMSGALEKLSTILSDITQKASLLETEGKDTTALDSAIAAADAALSEAETAVSAQAGNEYVITITDETTLRSTVGTTTSQLHTDLRDTHKTVVAAKQAIMTAAKELAKLRKGGSVASPSATTE